LTHFFVHQRGQSGAGLLDEPKPGRVFRVAMTEYLNWADLKTIIISLITGVIGGLIVLGIARYWSNRSIRSLNRRIQETEAEKLLIENLAKSEKAVLIYGFQTLFVTLGIMSLVIGAHLLVLLEVLGDLRLALWVLLIVLWGLPALVFIYSAFTIKKVRDYPGSLELFENRIAKLKSKLPGK
jgi:hypothetical protein